MLYFLLGANIVPHKKKPFTIIKVSKAEESKIMDNRRLSLLYNLQNLYNQSKVGSIEYILSSYLIDHYQEINQLNIFEVAEQNNVSRASVRRFCLNLGYKNFKELKEHFSEFDEGLNNYQTFYNQNDFASKLRKQIKIMFEEIEERLATKELNRIVETIYEADEVLIIASSTIANNIRVFQQVMAILGKRITITANEEDFEDKSRNLTNDSIILFFSISGVLAETFLQPLEDCIAKKYLFTNSRNPIFNSSFDQIYHLSNVENQRDDDIVYYTYGINFVLDSICYHYSKKY